jgi:hypothetical protein
MGLMKPSVAACNWREELPQSEVTISPHFVPPGFLERILAMVKEC